MDAVKPSVEVPPVILIVAIPEATVIVEIPAPRKSSMLAPTPTDPPAVFTPIIVETKFAVDLLLFGIIVF
jgi:hypothetical protein